MSAAALVICLIAPTEPAEPAEPGIILPGERDSVPSEEEEAEPEPAESEGRAPAGFGQPRPEPEAEADPDFIDQPGVDRDDHGKGTRPDWAKPKRPAYPPLRTRFGLTAGPNSFGAGAGLAYFVVPYVGIGAEIEDFGVWDDYGSFNVFQLTPLVWLMILPRRVVSPFLRGGFGGEFMSRQLGVYGRWIGGSGLVIRIRRRWSVELGLDVDGRVPLSRWQDNLQCGPLKDAACTIFFTPRLGFGAAFDTM